ncbi:polysaccharide biosynthesis tyrosine autokinase [Thalassoglobus polymorphus]|uniref:Tyrosine-protein kinase wzc n=1 Tax=Thalassoglobus polymorphus TaxID=2527994 RepID=A0A517QSM4_9PLAN|nr:polysaccharide biosynthesis tyrosine autokinase [Thalassoglobus polymorphus]QDT34629.1 Tyrosine-protein kinase wzc [Thalassoglobus polymorphus]
METQLTSDSSSSLTSVNPVHEVAQPRATSVGPHPNQGNEAIDTRALLNSVRRNWFVATLLGLIFGTGAAVATWVYVPAPYQAFFEFHINSVESKILFETSEAQSNFNTYKQTQMRKVTGEYVLNAALRDPEISNLPTLKEQQHPTDWLEKNLKVTSPASEFFRLELEGDRPKDLAMIVNAVADAFLTEVVNKERTSRQDRLRQLQGFYRDINEELGLKRTQLEGIAQSLKTTDPEILSSKRQLEYEYYGQLREEFTRLRFELMQANIQLAARQPSLAADGDVNSVSLPAAEPPPVPQELLNERINSSPEYQRISNSIRELEWSITDKSQNLGEKHPDRVRLNTHIERQRLLAEELKKQIEKRILAEIAANEDKSIVELQSRVKILEAEKNHLEQELSALKIKEAGEGTAAFNLEELKREITHMETTESRFRTEIEALLIEIQAKQRITENRRASTPHTPQMSKKYKMAGMAGLAALGLIAGGIIFLDYRRRRVSTAEEITENLRIRILGVIPILPRTIIKAVDDGKRKLSSQQVALRSVLKEAIDSTRAVLLRDPRMKVMNTILITSASDGEGKTSNACHLAASLARSGRKVVLVDCDMRRPTVHRVFRLNSAHGFCEILRGDKPLEGAAQPTPTPGLSVIPAGRVDSAALQALAEGGAGQIFKHLTEDYDYVIVDSAPILPVADTLLLAQDVDGVILTIRRDVSRLGNVAAAQQRLEMIGVPPIGSILIGLDEFADKYGYYSRHYNTLDVS